MRAQFVTSEIAIGLRRNLTMTIAVVLVTALSLGAVGAALLFGKQVNLMKGYWYDKVEVTVYLCTDIDTTGNCHGAATQDNHDEIQAALTANPVVKHVFYESKTQAYTEFKTLFKDSPEIVKNVTPTSLPDSFRVKLKDPQKVNVVASDVANRPGVYEVQDVKKALDPIFKFLNGLRLIALVVAGVALLASVLLVFNTIRVAAFSRRRETGIMRLVGASNIYIRLPFLLEGAVAGIIGAGFACGAVALGKTVLIDGILKPSIKFTPFLGWDVVIGIFPWLFVIGIVMATASSYLAIQRHLRV